MFIVILFLFMNVNTQSSARLHKRPTLPRTFQILKATKG